MANFICPFSKKVCSPYCKEWVFEKTSNNKLMNIIPIKFNTKDFLFNNLFMNSLPTPVQIVLDEYRKYYDLYHPEQTSVPRGRCKRIERMNYDLTLNEESDI
jgi:hypothetical protein